MSAKFSAIELGSPLPRCTVCSQRIVFTAAQWTLPALSPPRTAAGTLPDGWHVPCTPMQAHVRDYLHMQIADYSKHLTNWSPLMKAVVIHSFGNVDVLKLEDLPMPVPQADEVLVKVNAAGANPVD